MVRQLTSGRFEREMLTFAAYPVFQDKKAPRPRTYPENLCLEGLDETLTVVLSRCPPVRGTYRRLDRSERTEIDENL